MQKFGIELKTVSSEIYLRWEFKIGFKTETIKQPKQYEGMLSFDIFKLCCVPYYG